MRTMKNDYIRFFKKAILLTLMCVVPIVSFNYTVDPYGIFRRDFSKQRIEPNQQIIKMRYLLANPDRYDSYLFGSSRVGNIDNEKIRGEKVYNMTYSQAVPQEYAENIKLLLEKGIRVKTLLIGLEDFSFKLDPQKHAGELIRHPYSRNPFDRLGFYIRYLFKSPDPTILKPYFQKTPERFPTYYDIWDSGRPLHPEIDEYIDRHPEEHVKDPKFNRPAVHKTEFMADTLAALRQIVDLADQHGIQLIVFINPTYHLTYRLNDPEQFLRFKAELVKMTGFYDFSGINSVTTNKMNYYETSHFRVHVGDLMLARIFQYGDVSVPDDFGVYVTKENFGEHAERLRKELK